MATREVEKHMVGSKRRLNVFLANWNKTCRNSNLQSLDARLVNHGSRVCRPVREARICFQLPGLRMTVNIINRDSG